MKGKLSLTEQETVILWNNKEGTANIYTHDARLKHRLQKLTEQYPSVFTLKGSEADGAETYEVSKRLISIRSPFDDDRRQQLRERAVRGNYIKRLRRTNQKLDA